MTLPTKKKPPSRLTSRRYAFASQDKQTLNSQLATQRSQYADPRPQMSLDPMLRDLEKDMRIMAIAAAIIDARKA